MAHLKTREKTLQVMIGSKVLKKDEKKFGTVAHVVNDSWTGEIKKVFVDDGSGVPVPIAPDQIREADEGQILLNTFQSELMSD